MNKLVGVVALLALIVALVWTWSRREPMTARPAIAALESNPPTHALETPELAAVDANPVPPERVVAAVEPAAAAKPNDSPTESKVAEIRGRFLLPTGVPAAGVELMVNGWPGNQDRVRQFGMPEKWKDPAGVSTADGSFSLRFDPPRAFQFTLNASLSGYCAVGWRWGEIAPSAVVDVGDVMLERGGSIRGRIVDAKGRVLTKGWTVYADSANANRMEGREPTRARAAADPTTGEFTLEGLPQGAVGLKANSRIANWIDGPVVEVKAGEETRADILYTGPDNSSRITVVTFCKRFHIFSNPNAVFLIEPGGNERTAAKIEHSSQSFSFDELPPGSYRIEIRDPRFKPWSKDGVEPGTSVDAKLEGNASISLAVVDDATNDSVTRYSVDVRFDKSNTLPNVFRLLEAKNEPPANGLFDGLIPTDQTLIVNADGYGALEVPISNLQPNEGRGVTSRLLRGGSIAGTVVAGPGKTPVAGAKIELTSQPAQQQQPSSFATRHRQPEHMMVSDANGRFAFTGLGIGEWSIRASLNYAFATEQTVTVSREQLDVHTEVDLPPRTWLVGKLVAPPGTSFDDLKLTVSTTDSKPKPGRRFGAMSGMPGDDAAAAIGADGSFRAGPFLAGEVIVHLVAPPVEMPTGLNSSSTTPGGSVEIGRLTLAPEAETQHDFDVTSLLPGRLSFRARVDGALGARLLVRVMRASGVGMAAGVVLDAQGEGVSQPLFPGTYRVTVGPIDSKWSYLEPNILTIRGGEKTLVQIDVALAKGTLTVLDRATDRPLVNTRILLTHADLEWSGDVSVTTDAEGRVTLQTAPGRYAVCAHDIFSRGNDRVLVEWTAAGPVPPVVSLPTKP